MKTQLASGILLFVSVFAANGCSSDAVEEPAPPEVRVATRSGGRAAGTSEVLGVWRGHFDGRKLTFTPVVEGSGLGPQNFQAVPQALADLTTVESIVVNDGTADPLKTQCTINHDDYTDTPRRYFGRSAASQPLASGGPACENEHLCANVRLQNLTSRTLDNVYIELSGMTAGFAADNSVTDAPTDWGMSTASGLWGYGSLEPDEFSTNRRWNIHLPNCSEFDLTATVKATARPSQYDQSALTELSASDPFLDACTSPGSVKVFGDGVNPTGDMLSGDIAVGFPFSIYGTTFSSEQPIRIGSDGRAGLTLTGSGGSNGPLPAAGQAYAFFPFWYGIDPRVDGVCYARTGSAGLHDRKFIVTWKNADLPFTGEDENLTFSLVLYEGSDVIDFQYRQWTWDQDCSHSPNTTSKSRGSEATIGIQGSSSVAREIPHEAGTGYVLPPGHNVCPAYGQRFRFTPTPASDVFE